MYNAHGRLILISVKGSTRLHLDLTDAGNLCIKGLAIWTVFRSEDLHTVVAWIQNNSEECGHMPPGHPIHNQQVYLTPKLLARLRDETGVVPYVIHQYPGQFVVIPAGALHQVREL